MGEAWTHGKRVLKLSSMWGVDSIFWYWQGSVVDLPVLPAWVFSRWWPGLSSQEWECLEGHASCTAAGNVRKAVEAAQQQAVKKGQESSNFRVPWSYTPALGCGLSAGDTRLLIGQWSYGWPWIEPFLMDLNFVLEIMITWVFLIVLFICFSMSSISIWCVSGSSTSVVNFTVPSCNRERNSLQYITLLCGALL